MNNPIKTACDLKWNYPIFLLDRGEFRSCCRTPSKKVSKEDLENHGIDAFLNSEQERQERFDLVKGVKTSACSSCWKLEDSGVQSPRHNARHLWSHFIRSNQIEDKPYTEEYLKIELDKIDDIDHHSLYSYHPYMLEVSLGNTCDLKCMYCSHHYSTQWASEKIKYGEITQEQYDKEFPKAPDGFNEKFWDWFNKIGRYSIKRFGVIGGEPLIMPEFYSFLDKAIDSVSEIKNKRKEKITFWIVTNLNTPQNYLKKLLNYLPKICNSFNLEILVSMESIGEKAEYIRNGVKWDRFLNNLDTLLSNKSLKFNFGFIMSLNVLNITSLQDFISFTKKLYEKYDRPVILKQNLISYPSWQSPMILSTDFIPYIKKTISYMQKYSDSMPVVDDIKGTWPAYIKFLETIIDSINNTTIDRTEDRKKFIEWFEMYDSRRNLNLLKVFPEYKNFYNLCKSYV